MNKCPSCGKDKYPLPSAFCQDTFHLDDKENPGREWVIKATISGIIKTEIGDDVKWPTTDDLANRIYNNFIKK